MCLYMLKIITTLLSFKQFVVEMLTEHCSVNGRFLVCFLGRALCQTNGVFKTKTRDLPIVPITVLNRTVCMCL